MKGCCIVVLLLTQTVHADRGAIRRVVKQHLPKVHACLETHYRDLPGKLVVDFTIDTRGHVTFATVSGGTNRALQARVAQAFATMKFAPSREPTKVRYPMHICTAGQ